MGNFADLIDGLIEPFDPARVRRRMAERLALREMRQYDAAGFNRRTQGWRRPSTSGDAENRAAIVRLRNSQRDLARNNKYVAAMLRQMRVNAVGDGITARLTHPDVTVAQAAQDDFNRFAEGRVDGRNDLYGVQRNAWNALVDGDALIAWSPDGDGPDGRCRVLEGDFLDHLKDTTAFVRPGGPRIVQGVEYDTVGDRAGYWLYPEHPGDRGGWGAQSVRFAAADVDHLFDEFRPGLSRGIAWLAPLLMGLRDLGDLEDAVLMKKKVAACLALVLTPPESGTPTSPFDEAGQSAAAAASAGGQGQPARALDTLRPGMVFRARPGETATTVNPVDGGGEVEFIRQQLMAMSATTAPYNLISGDPSQANYSSQRAQQIGFHASLDDWQQNILVPHLCAPAVARRMKRLALLTGDRRFLQVRPEFAMPVRRLLDPLKDIAGEVAEIRSGLKTMPKALAERGLHAADQIAAIKAFNDLADAAALALETDPRRVTQSGVVQAGAGYLAPRGD